MTHWLKPRRVVFLVAVLVIVAVGITYAVQIQRGIGGSLIIGRVQTVDETIRVYGQVTPFTADLTELNFGTADLNAFGVFTPLSTFPLWVENGGDVPFSLTVEATDVRVNGAPVLKLLSILLGPPNGELLPSRLHAATIGSGDLVAFEAGLEFLQRPQDLGIGSSDRITFTALFKAAAPIPVRTPTPTPTPRPVPTPTPTQLPFVTSTTKTLVAAWGPPVEQPLVPWYSRGIDLHIYHFYERLIGLNNTTGAEDPSVGLAESWTISPDGKDFTFRLRKGVQFHGGWGEFTTADVVHMAEMLVSGDSTARDKPIFEGGSVQAVDDYTVIIRQARPDVISIPNHCSGKQGACAAMSKAFWDAEGKTGYSRRPVSTGPWQFASWVPGNHVIADRVTGHWRKTPEFEQFKLVFAAEAATRMAMLVTDAAHMINIPREVQTQFTDWGFSLTFSQLPTLGVSWHYGGSHFEYDKLVAAGFDMTTGRSVNYPQVLDDAYFAVSPWTHPVTGSLVREAFSRAVNRTQLNNTLFAGQGEPAYVWGMHSSLNGWNPRWQAEFDAKYGYDPDRAVALLAEAGYGPGSLNITVQTYPRFDFSENIAHIEVMADYFEAVGISVTLMPSDTATRNRQQRERSMQGQVEPFFGGYRPYQETMRPYHAQPGGGSTYENVYTWQTYDELVSNIDFVQRAAIVSQVGDHMFDNYASIPLFWFRAPALLNPNVVADYTYPGNSRRVYTHTEYIKAANVR